MKKIVLIFTLISSLQIVKAQKNVSQLDIENNEDFSSFAMLDSVVSNYSVFFTGENHNFRTSNYKLQLKMLKYLYKMNGTRHLFLEFGVSRGWLVNSYVQSGDSSLFKILEDYSYDEYALLYKGLMEFNKTLPEDKKIMVHGIDIERSYSTPIKAMSMLLPTSQPPKSISLNIETLKSLAGFVDDEHDSFQEEEESDKMTNYNYNYNYGSRYSSDNTLELIIRDYDSLKPIYQQYLGDNAPLFDLMVEGVKAEIKRNEFLLTASMQSFIYREQFMYESLLSLVKQYPGEKFYGQFGRCHTPVTSQDKWCDFYFFNSLANRLTETEEVELKGKVMSIGIYYPGSTTFETEATYNDKLEKLFELQSKEGIKLIHIDKKDSLFSGVYDKYQFIIVNSDAFKIEENNSNSNYTDYSSEVFSYGYTFPNIEGHLGYMFLNLKNLDGVFNNYGLPDMKSPQMFYGGAVTLYEDWFMYGSVSLHVIPKSTNRYNDSTELSFKGHFVKGYLGIESTASERFNIIPRIGFGYGRLEFEQRFDQPLANMNTTSIFGSNPVSNVKYYNNALLVDPSIDIRYNIRYVAIGLNTGYQIDLSDRTWYSDQTGIISDSPKTSLSGFYVNFTLSLFYSIW